MTPISIKEFADMIVKHNKDMDRQELITTL